VKTSRAGTVRVVVRTTTAAGTLLDYAQRVGANHSQIRTLRTLSQNGPSREHKLRLRAPSTADRNWLHQFTASGSTDGKPIQPTAEKSAEAVAAEPVKIPVAALDLPIEELDLVVRTYNLLKRELIDSIGELVSRTEGDLLDIRNLSGKTIDEIKQKLWDQTGLTLKNGTPPKAEAA
jgi:hypothetical protein